MEPFSIHPGGCSCTGCVYRSRSKEPSVQQLLQEGSDIDKLFFGKFLPLRERKLLQRLIRTRDVYDDVRNQLLSSASDQTIPKHKKRRRDEDLSSEQSSAVLKMVDLVDRGQIGSANASKAKLGSCCSCCSCETLRKIRKQMEREDKKHPKVHRQIVTCEDIAKYCKEAEEKGRKRRRKLSTKISKLSSKVGSARSKIKRNLSEPTVVSKSRAFVKRIRSKRKATDSSTEIVTRDQQTKTTKGQRRKVKKNQSNSTEDIASVLGPLAAKRIKDSLILIKIKLLKQRPYAKNIHVECEPGTCEEGTCSPEECLKKIQAKVGDSRRRKHHNRHSETGRHKSHISMTIRPKKVKVSESQVEIAKNKSSSSMTISKMESKGKTPVSLKPVKGKHGKTLSKSAASMTSLPRLKTKAQLATEEEKIAPQLKSKTKRQPVARHKNLEENVPVVVLPKSKTKAKTATKSTSSSLTSVAKEKATTAGSKNTKTLKRHEGEPASPPKRHKTGRQKPSRDPFQDTEETDIPEPIEHVKAKTEKRMKLTHGKKQRKHKHSKTHFAGASPKASQHSRDSASQSFKPHGRNVLSKSQGRSILASMERLKRKSVGSAAILQKTSSGLRTKSKQQQSKSTVIFPRKSKHISKELPPEIEENYIECHPNRQAVKISSSFSFNIEFHKDTYPCLGDDEQPDFEPPHTTRRRRRIKQTQHRRKVKDQATGHTHSRYNMSSQSDSTQSFKSTQVAHKLKRCFCTQKMIQTKNQKLNYVESKKTMASLDTREREVVARQIRTQTKHSGIAYVVPRSTSTHGKNVSRDINTTDTQRDAHSPKVSSDRWDGTGQRQAVRIGSNFNFSVEFSKTNINDRVTANAMIYNRPIQMERRKIRPKGIKVYKPSVRHETSETTRINVKTKQTHTEPFLQRCLCTLKLLKKNKKKVENLSPWRNRDQYVMHMKNGAENRYNPERSKFLQYDCEKKIKLRQIKLKHKYLNKRVLGSRSTSENTTSSDSQNTQFFTRESRQKINKLNQHYNEMNITRDRFQQRVMRGGSNLSSKNFKEKSAHYKRKDNFITTEDCINKHTQNKYKSNTKDSQQVEHPANHTSLDIKPKLEKGNSVVSVIKKCLSILKFPRKTNKLELQNRNNVSERTSYPFPSSQISEYKNTRTRSRKLLYDSNSHERSPNFFIPGMRTPYERHEENKRRDIIKLNKPYTNLNRPNRKSVMSVTNGFSGSTKAKGTQSRLLKHKTKEDQIVRHKKRGMKPARSFSPSRLAVCEGSNFSFNKKKSTNRSIPSIRNTTNKNRVKKHNTVCDISTINRMKDQLCPSQENNFRKERKASDIALFLKKCFCRLGLQKKNIPEHEFHWQQPITSQFVQVKQNNKKTNRHNLTKSGCNVVNKTLNTKEPLVSKLPEGRYGYAENLFESQNVMKTPRCNGSHHLPNGSFTRRGHIRSQIDVNFDKIKNLLNIQKINPFYQSFYALNVVCKSNVKSYGSIDAKASKTLRDMPDLDCHERCKREFGFSRKMKRSPGKHQRDKPLTLGSDFKIRAGVYKNTNPYKDGRRQAVRLGSDARVDVDFFRESPSRQVEDTTSYDEHRRKSLSIKHMMKRFSKGSAKWRSASRSDLYRNDQMDEMSIYRDPRERKSTPRLPYRRKIRKSGSVQSKESAPQPARRNNVKFCTDVNCLEYYAKERRRKGEGDVGKQYGSKTVMDRLKKKTKTQAPAICRCRAKTKAKSPVICTCGAKIKAKSPAICTCGAKTKAKSPAICTCGADTKANRQLEEDEREMETIMPYSKKTFKKLKSLSKLPTREQNVCPITCGSFKNRKEKRKEKRKEQRRETGDGSPGFEMTLDPKEAKEIGGVAKGRKKEVKEPVDNSPRFEVTLNTANMNVVNKEEVLKEMSNISEEAARRQEKALKQAKGHGRKCKCCVCRNLRKDKTPLAMKPGAVKKPCVCGSVVCKKDWDKIREEEAAQAVMRSKIKTCVCGSPVCEAESSKRPDELLQEARQEEHTKALKKRAKLKEEAYQKARKQRKKSQAKERKKLNKKRKKEDRAEMKSVRKIKPAGDVSMIAESFIDLGTFGSKAFCDIARYLLKGAIHPRDVVSDFQGAMKDPSAAAKTMSKEFRNVGLGSTFERMKLRLLKMPVAARAVKELESYPSTNYILHMADKDPKARMKNFKKKHVREPLDFGCSPYMASMRKRPCLRVYYMCPWFYPHCMSLLGLWKQLQDVLLFILAVAVWSPCIMCMELVRGFVCCIMCQG